MRDPEPGGLGEARRRASELRGALDQYHLACAGLHGAISALSQQQRDKLPRTVLEAWRHVERRWAPIPELSGLDEAPRRDLLDGAADGSGPAGDGTAPDG